MVGGQTHSQRVDEIASFTEGESQIMIANPASGGTGQNWQCAPYSIYLERSFDLGHRIQSQDRNYRGGSEVHETIIQIDIIAKDTIEETILKSLENKWSMAQLATEVRKHVN